MADTAGHNPRRRPALLLGGAVLLSFMVLAVLWPARREADNGSVHIVCTFLPVYVFTLNVVGDTPGVDVQLLIDRDVGCPHTYSLTGQDMKKVARANIVIANGLGIEPFLDQVLRGQPRTPLLTISDDCDVLHLEPGEHEAHGQAAEAAHPGSHEDCELNPHAWVSPFQAARQVRTLARKLGSADPSRAAAYRANGETCAARLEALGRRMQEAAKGFTNRRIVTGHAAFDYLARDLDLTVVATLRVVPGETGSAAEMARVVGIIRRTGAAAVFWEPPLADKVAETIAREAGVPVYPLNPFNTDAGLPAAKTPLEARRMYEDVMEQNLATLRQALTTRPTPS
jgi:ABC-type Zn uptake system ZnuABC Zn-binding protein ZnuA